MVKVLNSKAMNIALCNRCDSLLEFADNDLKDANILTYPNKDKTHFKLRGYIICPCCLEKVMIRIDFDN